MDSYSVELAKSAEKELRRIDGRYISRVFAAVESLAKEPRPVGCKKLTGRITHIESGSELTE